MSTRRGRKKAATKKSDLRVNVSLNENNEIELMTLEENTQDTMFTIDEEGTRELDDVRAEPEPKLIQTEDGHMVFTLKSPDDPPDDPFDLKRSVCKDCKKGFSTESSFKNHLKSCIAEKNRLENDRIEKERQAAALAEPGKEFEKYYNKNPEHPCYCCGEETETAHVGHIKCELCPKTFKTYMNLEKHISSIHSDIKDFQCTQCNAACCSNEILQEHYKTHQEGKPFSCMRCGKDFTRKYHLERHLNYSKCSGSEKQNELPCEVCKKVFSRIDNLREHLRQHMGQSVRKRDYQCPYCPKSFYGSSLLNIHIRTHTGERPFPCDLCSNSFPSNGALRKHRRMHTGERPYSCTECSAKFSAKETLNRHRKTHTGEKPHECTECGRRFIQATQLRSHMFHHTGKDGFECDICGRAFNRKIRLTEHITFVHEGAQPLECGVCPKTFTRKEDLIRHRDLHTGIKEFKCDVCAKEFATKPALRLHLRTHTREEPVHCKLCKKRFIRLDCLTRHIRSKHKENLQELIVEIEAKRLVTHKAAGEETDEEEVITVDGEIYRIENIGEIKVIAEKNGEIVENEELIDISENISTTNLPINSEITVEEIIIPDLEKIIKKEKVSKLEESTPIFLSDKALKQNVSDLLKLLIEEEILIEFGWPKAPVEEVLSAVIKRCGHTPSINSEEESGDAITRMRENTKILFALTMESDNIQSLLNNHTVDEVIVNVLKSK